jgi:RND superfamily putative drug exporter
VLIGWVLVLALCVAAYPSLQRALGPPTYAVEGSESARVEQLLEKRFPSIGTEDDAMVFSSSHHIASDQTYRGVIASVVNTVRHLEGVRSVLGPYDHNAVGQISSDEHAAVAVVALNGDVLQRYTRARHIQQTVTRETRQGVHVWLTGYSPLAADLSNVSETDVKRAEAIGVPIAFLILLVTLGAVVAASIPLLIAGAGLLLTFGGIAVMATAMRIDIFLISVVTMLGVGIGIDYALFIISRFREELVRTAQEDCDESERIADAIGTALMTSGRTILFSGTIIALSLMSLIIIPGQTFREMALGSVVVVVCTLTAALVLLPAILAMLGTKINGGRLPVSLQPANLRSGVGAGRGMWARWAFTVMRHPAIAAMSAAAVLILAASPLLGLRYGINQGVLTLPSTPSGAGAKVLASTFAPGAVSPIQILVAGNGDRSLTSSGRAGVRELTQELEHDSQVTGVIERGDDGSVVLAAVSSAPIDTPAATALVRHIRDDLAPPISARRGLVILVGGATAFATDLSDEMREKLPVVVALILGVSLLFLLVVFRSIILPIKAVIMNLLSTGAAVGLVVLIFQDGHGEHLLNFTSPGFVQAYIPLFVFALVFGLSMDYEVFLVRRMQEGWKATGDNQIAVATGVEHTARSISAAAAIMVAVFGSFVFADLLEIKQLGFALAVAVAIDATLVRLVLVPALMCFAGAWNWWLPAPLARLLPDVVEID